MARSYAASAAGCRIMEAQVADGLDRGRSARRSLEDEAEDGSWPRLLPVCARAQTLELSPCRGGEGGARARLRAGRCRAAATAWRRCNTRRDRVPGLRRRTTACGAGMALLALVPGGRDRPGVGIGAPRRAAIGVGDTLLWSRAA
jgi:hypothetical protein